MNKIIAMVFWLSNDPKKAIKQGLPYGNPNLPNIWNIVWSIGSSNIPTVWLKPKITPVATPPTTPTTPTPPTTPPVSNMTQVNATLTPTQPTTPTSPSMWSIGWSLLAWAQEIPVQAWPVNPTTPTETPTAWWVKLTVQEFANRIKTKYPMYADIDSKTLTEKMMAKYPEYQDMVNIPTDMFDKVEGKLWQAQERVANAPEQQIGWRLGRWVANAVLWAAAWVETWIKWLYHLWQKRATRQMRQFIPENIDLPEQFKSDTKIQQDILDVAEWTFNTALNIMAPEVMVWLSVVAETKLWAPVVEAMGSVMEFAWNLLTYLPWLEQYNNSLSEEDQVRFKSLLGNAATMYLLWAKYKWEKITNPTKFVADNMNPVDVITTFKNRVLWVPLKIAEWIKKIPEKVADTFKKTSEKVDNIDRIASNVFGLDAETVSVMRQNVELIKAIEDGKLSKEWIKEDLLNMVDEINLQKWEVGREYQTLYEQPNTFETQQITTLLRKSLEDKGVVFDEAWNISSFDITNKNIAQTPIGERNLIKAEFNDIVSSLADKINLSVEELHNIKKGLWAAQYTEWVMVKKSPILKEMSNVMNEQLKRVEGRELVDAKYSAKAKELQKVAKLVATKWWEFKWTLKALLWERQYGRLQELEAIYPWLTKKLEAIKAYDDYLRTRETKKVWDYGKVLRGAIGWWLWYTVWSALLWPVGWYLWGLVWAIISNHLTDPKMFKDFILKNVKDWDTIVEKMNKWVPTTETEQKAIIDALESKKWNEPITPNEPNTPVKPSEPPQRGPQTPKEGLQAPTKEQAWSKWLEKKDTSLKSKLEQSKIPYDMKDVDILKKWKTFVFYKSKIGWKDTYIYHWHNTNFIPIGWEWTKNTLTIIKQVDEWLYDQILKDLWKDIWEKV